MTPGSHNEESEDARMRALFGDMSRPPMGDEEFVRSVMGRVSEVRANESVRRNAMALGVLAVLGGMLWPFKGAIYAAVTLPLAKYVPSDLPMLSASATGLLIAAAASIAALAYSERA